MFFFIIPTLYFLKFFLADRVNSHVFYFQREALVRLPYDSSQNDNSVSFSSPEYVVEKILVLTKTNKSNSKSSNERKSSDWSNEDTDLRSNALDVNEEDSTNSTDTFSEEEEIEHAGMNPQHSHDNLSDEEEEIEHAGMEPQDSLGNASDKEEKIKHAGVKPQHSLGDVSDEDEEIEHVGVKPQHSLGAASDEEEKIDDASMKPPHSLNDVSDVKEKIDHAGVKSQHSPGETSGEKKEYQHTAVKPQHLRGKTSKVDEEDNFMKDLSEEVLKKNARAAQSRLAFSSARGSNAGPGQFRGNCGMYQGIQGAVIPCIGDSLSASFALDPLRNSFTNHEPSPITRSDISFNENNMWDI